MKSYRSSVGLCGGLLALCCLASVLAVLCRAEESPQKGPPDAPKTSPATTPVAAPVYKPDSNPALRLDSYELLMTDDTHFRLADRQEKVIAVAFVGVHCPLANLYLSRLQELADRFEKESVLIVAVNSNAGDTLPDMREQHRRLKLRLPLLKDAGNNLADVCQATRTPEVVVLNAARVVQYRGRIDNQYGYRHKRQQPTENELADTIAALLADKTPAIAKTDVEGCWIARKRPGADSTGGALPDPAAGTATSNPATVTYHNDIAPLLQKHCQRCHRQGEIGPFELKSYEDASNWAQTIREVVTERRMPPWLGDGPRDTFENDARLTDEEITKVKMWVDRGSPVGTAPEKSAEAKWTEGWNIGTPDKIYTMPTAHDVPARGEVKYQYFVMSEVFEEDRWVQAIECRPGDRAVVHHILALLMVPENRRQSQNGLERGFFAAAAPGSSHVIFPEGQAKKLPKGTQLVFQVHYTPNGIATQDQSSIGLIYAKEPPKQEVKTYGLAKPRLLIPAGESDHVETHSMLLPAEIDLCTLFPHLHVRGKSFEYRVKYPRGGEEVLLSVPRWDFNWQIHYRFAKPKRLPAGSTITITAHWDNSAGNPNNFFPVKDVKWGDQTWDEMFIGYADYVLPLKKE